MAPFKYHFDLLKISQNILDHYILIFEYQNLKIYQSGGQPGLGKKLGQTSSSQIRQVQVNP